MSAEMLELLNVSVNDLTPANLAKQILFLDPFIG